MEKQSFIYCIYDDDYFYIGSTQQKWLSQRITNHRSNYRQYLKNNANYCSSFNIFKNNLYPKYKSLNKQICDKEELRKLEQKYIDEYKLKYGDKVVNKQPSHTSILDKKANLKVYHKKYRKDNVEKLKDKEKTYYQKNKKTLLEKVKARNDKKKPQIKQYKHDLILWKNSWCGTYKTNYCNNLLHIKL